jgi:quinol monooxygenase YgiN
VFDLIVTIQARSEGDVAPLGEALRRMAPLCRREPGCLSWEAYHSNADSRRFTLVERWESEELWQAHGDLPAIQEIYLPEVVPRAEARDVHPSTRLTASDWVAD